MTGGAAEIERLAADDPRRADLIDDLARRARDDATALDDLLRVIDRRALAEPAIRRILIADHDVEEAGQDVLIAVAQGISSWEGRSRFTTWLYTVARNKAVELVRRRRATTDLPDEVHLSDAARISSLIANEAVVRQLLAELPDTYRRAVALRDVDGLAYAEIATILELNLNTVRSHIARGRALLAASVGS